MKFISKGLLIAVLILSSTGLTFAQNQKIGHISTAKLLQIMPGRDSAQLVLEQYAQSLQKDLEQYETEFNSKYEQFMATQEEMPKLMRETKQKELMEMQDRIMKYREGAQEDLTQKEQELLEPILQKAQDAIDKVAEENGFIYILDTSSGAVVFVSDKGEDIMSLVKKELGIEDVETPDSVEPVENTQQQPGTMDID